MLATYTGETQRALVSYTAGAPGIPREALVPATVKAGDVTSEVYAEDHQWFEVCPGPTCKVIRLIDEVEIEMEARIAGDLLEAPSKMDGCPVIRWYEMRTAEGQFGVAMVRRPDAALGSEHAWATWLCYPVEAGDPKARRSGSLVWGRYGGHYDLTAEEAKDDFFERCRGIGGGR